MSASVQLSGHGGCGNGVCTGHSCLRWLCADSPLFSSPSALRRFMAGGTGRLTPHCRLLYLPQSVSDLSPAPITSSVSDLSPAPITSGHLVPDTPRNNYVMAFPIVLTQGDPCLAGQKWNDSLTCMVAEVAGKPSSPFWTLQDPAGQ